MMDVGERGSRQRGPRRLSVAGMIRSWLDTAPLIRLVLGSHSAVERINRHAVGPHGVRRDFQGGGDLYMSKAAAERRRVNALARLRSRAEWCARDPDRVTLRADGHILPQ